MGGIRYVPVFILTALLVFGCLGAPQTPPAGDDTTVPNDTTVPPSGETPEAPEQPEGPTVPDNLEGLEYAALLALGQPIECDMTIPYGTMAQQAKIYMNGEDQVRMEITGTNPDCPTMVSVKNEPNSQYMGCKTGSLFEGSTCDWLLITVEPDPAQPDAGGAFETPDMAEIPPANIDCRLWIYDSTMFETPGSICTLEELFQMPESYQ